MTRSSLFFTSFPAALVLCAGSSLAAQDSADGGDYLATLKSCQAIFDDTDRLACFDKAVGTVVAKGDEGDLRIVDSEDIRQTRRGLFGFSLPKINLFGGDKDEENLTMLESTITSVALSGRDTVFFTIEGGALWQVKNAKDRTMRAKPGDTVVFKEAALGTYFIRINGQTGVKGTRVK